VRERASESAREGGRKWARDEGKEDETGLERGGTRKRESEDKRMSERADIHAYINTLKLRESDLVLCVRKHFQLNSCSNQPTHLS